MNGPEGLRRNLRCQPVGLHVAFKQGVILLDDEKRIYSLSSIENQEKTYDAHIKVRTDLGFEFVAVGLIAYCQADGNYTKVFLQDGRSYLISYSLKHVCKDLSPALILRVHQSFALNINCISRAILSGSYVIELNCGARIPVARRRRKLVKDRLLLN